MKKPGSVPAPKTHRSFKLVTYDPDWSMAFQSKAAILKQIFAPELIAIEHVGSTAVPGMWAKPQIDILVLVKNLDKIKAYYTDMQTAGFTPHGDYTGEGEEYFSEDTAAGVRRSSIHIMPAGHSWAEEMITFRDYLRTHPEQRDYYSDSKRSIAIKYKDDYQAYFLHKRVVVHKLRDKANIWKNKA